MADKEAAIPWSLSVTACIDDESRARYDSDEAAEALLRAKFDVLYHATLSRLRESGRVQGARFLQLNCNNHHISKEKECES